MKFTNKNNLPAPFIRYCEKTEHHNDGAEISVTSLIDSAQISRLQAEHDHEMTEDYGDQLMRLLGTAVHGVLETGVAEEDLTEKRFHATIGGTSVSGQVDYMTLKFAFDGVKHWDIDDWKVTSVSTMQYNPEGKREWHNQVNSYAFLARENGYNVESARVRYILRDWKLTMTKYNKLYPLIPFGFIDIPLWDHEDVRKYLELRVEEHSAKVPPLCSKEERWIGDPKFAVYTYVAGGALSKRAKRVLDSSYEAEAYILDNSLIAEVQERQGKPTRCEDWCPVSQWCEQYQSELGEGQ